MAVRAATTGALIPIADGAQRQWNGVPFLWPNNHYWRVDEAACNGNTDYNYTTTLGREDSYKVDLSSIPDGSTINKIIVSVCASAATRPPAGVFSRLRLFFNWNNGTIEYSNPSSGGAFYLSDTTPMPRGAIEFGVNLVKDSQSQLEIGGLFDNDYFFTTTTFALSATDGIKISKISADIAYTPPPLPIATNPPTNLRATYPYISDTSALLQWNDNSNDEFGFIIERSVDGINYTSLATVTANTIRYADTTINPLLPTGYYYYRVQGYRLFPNANSAYSNVATVFLGGPI